MLEDGSAAVELPHETAIRPLAVVRHVPNAVKFTKENAAEMARRAAISRKRNQEQRRIDEIRARENIAPSDSFVSEQIASVRAQIKRLNVKLLTLHDSQKLNWIAAAVCKLVEQERVLSMRPEPPRLRTQGASGRPSQRAAHSLANPVE